MRIRMTLLLGILAVISSCKEEDGNGGTSQTADEALFAFVTQSDPFTAYVLFPDADSVTSGTLNGSTAHQPLVRVSLNSVAVGALENGTLPPPGGFPNGSVVFKQIITNNQTTLYAVMKKDSAIALSGSSWLWAEYYPDGRVAYSVENRGSGCTGCHALEQGAQNDHVRTFERQH